MSSHELLEVSLSLRQMIVFNKFAASAEEAERQVLLLSDSPRSCMITQWVPGQRYWIEFTNNNSCSDFIFVVLCDEANGGTRYFRSESMYKRKPGTAKWRITEWHPELLAWTIYYQEFSYNKQRYSKSRGYTHIDPSWN